MEIPNRRTFDELDKDEKIEAVLAVIREPVSKEISLFLSNIDPKSLSDQDKQKIEAILKQYEVAPDTYFLGDERRSQLAESIDMTSVNKKVADVMWNELDL